MTSIFLHGSGSWASIGPSEHRAASIRRSHTGGNRRQVSHHSDQVKGSKAGALPQTPPRGAAPWIPAKGEPLEPIHWSGSEGGGLRWGLACRASPARKTPTQSTPLTPTPMNGFQRLRLWWGSRGQSPPGGVWGSAPALRPFTRLPGARTASAPVPGRAATNPPVRAHDPSEMAAAPPGRATPSPGHRGNSRAARSG